MHSVKFGGPTLRWWMFVALVIGRPNALAAADTVLFDAVAAGHRQYVDEATHFLQATYERRLYEDGRIDDKAVAEIQSSKWWQNGTEVRAVHRITKPDDTDRGLKNFVLTVDHCRHLDKVQTSKTVESETLKSPQKSTTITGRGTRHDGGVDLWSLSGNLVATSPSEIWLFEQLGMAGKITECKGIEQGGRRLILVEKRFDRKAVRAIVDSEKGFCPVKVWIFSSPDCDEAKSYWVTEIEQFWTPSQERRVYFPKQVSTHYYGAKGQLLAAAVTTITLVRTGQPFPSSQFDASVPVGSMVVDQLSDSIYKAGPDGQRDPKFKPRRVTDIQIPEIIEPTSPEEQDRPFPYRTVGLALAGVFFVAAYFLRRLRRRESA